MAAPAVAWVLCTETLVSVALYKTVSEFLIRRLGEYRPFPEIRGETPVGLGNGIKSGLGNVAPGGGAAPGGT